MQFAPPLIEGRLIRRYKRFLADVRLSGGEVVVAHCPNPGSMDTCAPPGAPVWLSRSDNPRRKLAYTWELVQVGEQMVCIHTGRANDIVAEALESGLVRPMRGYDELRREVAYGERSRVDFLLRFGDQRCYLEVKSVTLDGGPGVAAFPDSVTARGTRHLGELVAMRRAGHRAALLFCVNRSGVRAVRPADEIDPAYGEALRTAHDAGVEILAYRCDIAPTEIVARARIPVRLARRSRRGQRARKADG